jgi:hypothetical protein
MAQIIKKNEAVQTPFFKNGVTLDFYTITFPSDVSGKLTATAAGARSPVVVALEAIQARTSVEIIGTLGNSGTTLNVAIASLGGVYPTDDYNKDGSPVTFAAYLQSLVTAEGTYQSVNLASATVARTAF